MTVTVGFYNRNKKIRLLWLVMWLAGLGLSCASAPALAQTVNAADEALITDRRVRFNEDFLETEIQQFLDKQPGSLKDYREMLYSGTSQSAARTIAAFCLTAELNPRVVLSLLEVKAALLSNPNPPPAALEVAFGFEKPEQKGFRRQLNLTTGYLSERWSFFEARSTLNFKNGDTRPVSPKINRGTYAVQAVLAATATPTEWLAQIGRGTASFYQVYFRYFGDPLAADASAGASEQPVTAPFLRRPFAETDLGSEGLVYGIGRNQYDLSQPASDRLNYNHPTDYGINTYFDHLYPSYVSGLPGGNPPDDRFPGVVVTYRGRKSGASAGFERAYSGHDGIDYDLRAGQNVVAAASGKITGAGQGGCGFAVIIDHRNGYRSLYLHLAQEIPVTVGAEVVQGQLIGRVGNWACTGPHLHFAVTYNLQAVDPFGFCPDEVKEDPWELFSGARSYWLWKDFDSACKQQYSPVQEFVSSNKAPNLDELTRGRGGTQLSIPVTPASRVANGSDADLQSNLALLNQPDDLVRQNGIEKLGRLGRREAVIPLLGLLTDPVAGTRWYTSQALVRLNASAQLLDAYLALLDNPNPEIRVWAVQGLAQRQSTLAIPRLIALLGDDSVAVRWQTVQTLRDLKADQALLALIMRLADDKPEIRELASEALIDLGSANSANLLKDWLTHADANTAGLAQKVMNSWLKKAS